ncbi:ABC-type transport auxiliary lipoprotein family protein [Phenylobacterium sp.]|uniref:ABC-type transport auxiliary lipoprotein family protein n=1 Tax=Phenylobacterium sp. TaxID=1871053 RepID=UPI00262FD27B|nr:ABC-type transport auxiliary lipoprotein family protein [Phenylobacterium sp.]
MSRAGAFLRLGAAMAIALALSGCVSLLPKSKPAQLYRFGATHAQPTRRPPGSSTVGVFWSDGAFQRESAADRILTVTGDKVAYIAEVRWAAPAEVLFDQAVFDAFDAAGGRVRLAPRGAPAPTDFVLRVDVRDFETRYESGPNAAPTVLVRLHATLTRDRGHTLLSDQLFEARAPAADNRVGAIVAAYDKAVNDVLAQLVAWTNEKTS